MLPGYLSPLISLIGSGVLYTMIYTDRASSSSSCMLIVYSTFICLMIYSFVIIAINVAHFIHIVELPQEFLILGKSFLPSLTLMPISFLVYLGLYFRRNTLPVCSECKMLKGDMYSRGKLGFILNQESNFQIRNMLIVFSFLSVIVWVYYLLFYIKINVNARDNYVFIWLAILIIVIDEIYFIFRYYNLYMDLHENNEILSTEDIENLEKRTYLRYYVICGNNIYVENDAAALDDPRRTVCDTPFFYKVSPDALGDMFEVRKLIEEKTGVSGGELRFFYEQTSNDIRASYSVARYFYFLDGDVSDYQKMNTPGEWMDYDKIKQVYSTNPMQLATLSVTDTTRLATIILTEKTFDENGNRKNKLKKYRPTFNLIDVRKSELNFQDNKWIQVSMFNSDVRFFRIKRSWFKFINNLAKTKRTWN